MIELRTQGIPHSGVGIVSGDPKWFEQQSNHEQQLRISRLMYTSITIPRTECRNKIRSPHTREALPQYKQRISDEAELPAI